MHFLLAIYQLKDPGGDEPSRDLSALCAALSAHGHGATVLTCGNPPWTLPASVTVMQCESRCRLELSRKREFVRAFQREAQRDCYDASLAFGMIPGGTLCIAYPDYGVPRHRHFRWFWQMMPHERFLAQLENDTLRPPSVTGICCLSRNQEYYFSHVRDIASLRLTVLPPQLNEELFDHLMHERRNNGLRRQLRQELGVNADGDIMAYLHATDWYAHGVDRALAALSVMPRSILAHTRLFIGGDAPGGSQGALNDMADELGLPEKCVCYTGRRHSVHQMLTAADLLLFPARSESTGECIVEALLHGVPVICTAECGYSSYAQSAGCPVIPSPFHIETLQDALAFSLPSLAVIRQSVEHFASTSKLLRRSDVLLKKLIECSRQSPCRRSLFTEDFIDEVLSAHRRQLEVGQSVLKDDAKRAVTRVVLPQGRFIVKEFRRRPWWHFRDQMNRTIRGTRLLRGFTPYCWGVRRDRLIGSGYLIFFDCGGGNFNGVDYAMRPDAPTLYAECGKLLARLHIAGLFHADAKTTNFVANENCRDECPGRVCIVDCDLVRKFSRAVPAGLRAHNAAQFIASTGKLARANPALWKSLVEAFRSGYNRHSHLSHADLDQLWQRAWIAVHADRHIECNLPAVEP